MSACRFSLFPHLLSTCYARISDLLPTCYFPVLRAPPFAQTFEYKRDFADDCDRSRAFLPVFSCSLPIGLRPIRLSMKRWRDSHPSCFFLAENAAAADERSASSLPTPAFPLFSPPVVCLGGAAGVASMRFDCEIVVDAGNELGEGVLWSPAHGEVQWTDIFGRRFWAHSPSDGQVRSVPLPDRLGCFAPLGGTSILAGFAGGLEMFDLEKGTRRLIAAIEQDRPTTRVNDGRLDRRGRLVFGTMDEDPSGARPLGQIWSFGGGRARVLASGVRIANSIAFSPDGRRMYFADTPEKRIRLYDYDLDSGVLSGERVFVTVEGPGFPDGSTVDAEGCLWNAEWGGGRVVRYAPDGRVIRVLPLPASQVTCCAFGGARLDRLYVTTARTGLDPSALAAEPHAGALFAFDVGVSGLADAPFDAKL
jgi:L-arabinonolactonase